MKCFLSQRKSRYAAYVIADKVVGRYIVIAGRADLVNNPRYSSVNDRHTHMGELLSAIREAVPSRTTREWLDLCQTQGIPASDLLDLAHAHENAYVLDQGLITKLEHPTEGEYYATRTPFAMSRTPISFSRHAPLLGEDTFTILEDLGYSADRVHALADASVVTATSPQATSS
ncbi:acyl-CoA transferase [Rhodococcus opacus]|uniref:Acyl-CoA transferase n=1 Tax=Rhodococcus opacus TaxID=37919 RepID=A0A1B1KF88_RHOOP|nr:CoA transferase [Rhodococcus opacus]ANS31219.1 acyl-CoA transferase [Rhodococcus opacus]